MRGRVIAAVALVYVLSYSLCQAQVISPLTDIHPLPKIGYISHAQTEWLSETNITLLEEKVTGLYENLLRWADAGGNVTACQWSMMQFALDVLKRKPYTKQAIDSFGKVESGVLMGNMKWYGRYNECIKTKGGQFQGKWCSLTVGNKIDLFDLVVGLTVGLCLPDTCSDRDLTDVVSSYVNLNGSTVNLQCPTQPTKWKAADVIFVLILSILVVLMVVGTVLDRYIIYKNQKTRNELNTDDDVDILPATNWSASPQYSVWEEVLISFSIVKNTKTLFSVDRKPGTIDCLHGMRFISMSWVVLGHTFIMTMGYMVANAYFSVDSFFFLSGLLVAYLSLKNANRLSIFTVPMLYLQRYLRLTPAYAFLILFSTGFYGKLGDGPNWPAAFNASCIACQKYWWTNLLYINNLHPSSLLNECFALGWYLANDMQFFVLAPISLLMIKRNPKVGVNLLIFGLFSSMLVTGVISSHYKLQPLPVTLALLISELENGGADHHSANSSFHGNLGEIPPMSAKDEFWSDTYAKPWCRIGVYLVGMITGYILIATKSSIKMTKLFALFGWAVAAFLNLSVVYGTWWYVHNVQEMEISLAAFYDALCRPIWAVGLAWVVIACVTGYGGPVNAFLSWKAFVPLSRLTFCTYLVHPTVIALWFATQEVDIHYSNTQFAFFYIAILTMSHGGAYILSMLVETPFVNLVKALTKNRERSEQRDSLLVNEGSSE